MAPISARVEVNDEDSKSGAFYIKPVVRFVLEKTPDGYSGSANVSNGNMTSAERLIYDEPGAAMYIIAVIMVYGLSIVLLIGTLVRKNMRKNGTSVFEESQVDKYLQDVPNLKERSQRDQYRELKGHMQRIVESNEFQHFNHDLQQQQQHQQELEREHRNSRVSTVTGARTSLDLHHLPARSLLSNCNDILMASVMPQTILNNIAAAAEVETSLIASRESFAETEPFLRVSSMSSWGRTSIYSKRAMKESARSNGHSRHAPRRTTDFRYKPSSNVVLV